MFKDYDKYLTTSLKVYLFVLIIIFILKLVGLDYFGIDINNRIIININEFCTKYKIIDLYYSLTLYIYSLFLITITFDRNDRKLKYVTVIFTIAGIIIKYIENIIPNPIVVFIVDFLYFFISLYIINIFEKKNIKNILKRFIILFLISVFYQSVTLIIRNVNYNIDNNFIVNMLLDFDYILLLIITYKFYFMKGVNIKCITEAGSFSLKKLNLKKSLKRLQKNWRNFKKEDKVTKLTMIIYFILSLIWNTLSIVLILFVATLNDTFIECLFILTSFWLSKRSFGKAFHFSSMTKCFIVSNLSYYVLNRLTTPLGISILVPIFLGVGLSYITSKFVKKTYKPLYRGMPEDLFEETILKVVDKNSTKYKICYDFYIKNKSVISLSMKYNYTESGIRKIKDRVNDKIKRLN